MITTLCTQLEDAQGQEDPVIRQALEVLSEKSKELQEASRRAAGPTSQSETCQHPSDIEIASNIDRCANITAI